MGNKTSKLSDTDIEQIEQTLNEDGPGQDIVEGITGFLKVGDVKIACDLVENKLNEFRHSKIELGIIGACGSGKSTLINTLRGLKPTDEGAAAVGVTETTTGIQYYTHPDFPQYTLSDLPGVGTRKFPKKTYVQVINIEQFKCLNFCSHPRLTENDIWIAQQAKERHIPFVFVRSKVDFDVQNSREDQGESFDECQTLRSIRESIVDNLTESDLPTNAVFLVSCKIHHIDKWDYNELVQYISQQLPKKAETAFIFSLMAKYSFNDMKRSQLLKRIPMVAFCATLRHFIGGCTDGNSILRSELQFYAKQFGVSEGGIPDMRHIEITQLSERFKHIFLGAISTSKGTAAVLGAIQVTLCITELFQLYQDYKIYLNGALETCFQKG